MPCYHAGLVAGQAQAFQAFVLATAPTAVIIDASIVFTTFSKCKIRRKFSSVLSDLRILPSIPRIAASLK